jgi:tol-pal system protein YbgF
MRRYWIILALLFVAATAEENRLYRVAEAAFNDKIYDVAERQFGEFLEKFPHSDHADGAQLLLAQAQLNRSKTQEAVRTLQDALTKWPDKRPDSFRFWLAEALARDGKFAEGAARYEEVVEKFPRSPYRAQALYGLAFTQLKQNQFDAASGTLGRLGRLSPKSELAQEAELLRGQVDLARGKFVEAEAVFNSVAKQFPKTRVFYRASYWLGQSLAQRKQYDDALKTYAVVTDAFNSKSNKPVDAALAAEAWYATGWVYWDTGEFDSAAEAFSAALNGAQSGQLKRDAMLKLSEAYVRGGKLADGVAKLREFLKAHPGDPLADEVQMAIADLLFGHDEFAAALSEYAQVITNYAERGSALLPKANFKAGWCAWKLNQIADALKHFQEAFALAKDPGMASEALFKIADAEFVLGQYGDAVTSYQRLIGTYPDTKLLDRAMFQLGEAYHRLRNAEAATATFESLVKQYPASEFAPEAQFTVGRIAVELGKEDDARAAFREVVSKFPQSDWAKKAALAIGESYRREGKYDQAAAEFDKLMAGGLDSPLAQEAFYDRGWCYAQQGQADKTLADFADFLAKYAQSPFAPDIQFWIADHHLKQKNYVKAQEQYQSLAEKYPTSKLADIAQYFAARAAYSRQDYRAAIDLFEGLLKKFPASSWRCDARFGQGDALTELGQFDNAFLVFDNLIKEFPDCYLLCEAQGRRGDCQFTLNRLDDAIASYRKALDCAHDAAMRNQVLFKIGQSYEKQGKLEDALQFYTKPLYEAKVAPDANEPPERFWACKAGRAAADIKEQQQQWRDAITLYQKLLESCPDLKPLVEDNIRRIRVEHVILF